VSRTDFDAESTVIHWDEFVASVPEVPVVAGGLVVGEELVVAGGVLVVAGGLLAEVLDEPPQAARRPAAASVSPAAATALRRLGKR